MARPRRTPASLTSSPAPAPAHSSTLDAARRRRELEALADRTTPVDVLVIGGGVTGAGVALDAASRGLSVVLAEAHDLAFGTSRWSSKLVHGGLRYLATGDVAVARESAVERHVLMTRVAPHLVRSLPQLLPFTASTSSKQRAMGRVGLGLGDGLRMLARTPASVLAHPRHVGTAEALALAPGLRREGLRGGMLSFDGQLVDDARLVVALARTAAAHGATVLTRVRVSDATADSATLTDTVTGESLTLRARAVVNAAGVWAGELDPGIRMRPSRGTHLVLDAAVLGHPTVALTVPHPGSVSRFVFALPQQLGRVVVGLTDEEAPGPIPDVPQPEEQEIDFLLRTISSALARSLGRSDVLGAFAGLRPLIDTGGNGGGTADISRRHHVAVSASGLVNVLGGKLTTYRAMARDAVDLACRHAGLDDTGCRTAELALVGAPASAVPFAGADAAPAGRSTAAHDGEAPASLAARFGAEASTVLALARCDRPADRVAPGIDVTRAEIEFAVGAEGALDVDDVLDRRTRIGLVAPDRERAHDAVAELVAEATARLS
ncbi:glycerol-3-phosphate dehydrogenase/oxidase [Agromyces endophyticus]|uniref:glycerol-3-phosphate dehydrogenase/oxidase n=1 Tax=Agromyces sp. H17E-10 TaxID=2932244 RepID=UPI001FD0CE37|nr:glycerol-3-phosphate dehydrogenase/oxidase [Agromyces sp. H17E-10]UOQ87826.1 glycerol-3-phosphate dehydrogenase/oxidase [Agromyces sp. H17E-10]